MVRSFLLFFGSLAFITTLLAVGGVLVLLAYHSRHLPDYKQLASYEPPITTRLYASDGRLLEEYAIEKRLFVPEEAIPTRVKQAFLAAEDKNFYVHHGVDFLSVVRAIVDNVRNFGSGRRLVGASTITQQVAKNFLLSSEVSMERKIREAILAFRIEKAFSKDQILELYLNQIFLGQGSYGVAAASMTYFNKSLDELSISEVAYLAALPKGPNNYHPTRQPEAARDRRDWVVDRMLEERYITPQEAAQAKEQPIEMIPRQGTEYVSAPFYAEEVRRILYDRYGEKGLYEGGLAVRTTIDPGLQEIATKALRDGLIEYDRRHGWRGPIANMDDLADWQTRLGNIARPAGLTDWTLAVVLKLDGKKADIGFADGSGGVIPMSAMKWAQPWRPDQRVGNPPGKPDDVLNVGDVVPVSPGDGDGKFALEQIPDVQGAIVVIDPQTGRVRAMQGGYTYEHQQNEFNRATQALRQPGSAFKPFVYLAALADGKTPATVILDAPFVHCYAPDKPCWKPDNYTKRFYGPTPLRVGIEKSRNLMTVRLAQSIGMEKVAGMAERFGIVDDMLEVLPMALGAGETTLLRLTTAYAQLVNGGRNIDPTFIDRVQDRHGRTIYRHDKRSCRACRVSEWRDQPVPVLPDDREQLVDPAEAFQIVSILEGVVKRGTGARIGRAIDRPLAGKTGTTNDNRDTWFVGFSPDMAVGVFVGFDQPRTLGGNETGSRAAAPIFQAFMQEALKGTPARPFRMPSGVRLVAIDSETGRRVSPGDPNAIMEVFKPGTEPAWNEIATLPGDEQRILDYNANLAWQQYQQTQTQYSGPGDWVYNPNRTVGPQTVQPNSFWDDVKSIWRGGDQAPQQARQPYQPQPYQPQPYQQPQYGGTTVIQGNSTGGGQQPYQPPAYQQPQQPPGYQSPSQSSGPVGGTGGIY